MALSNTAVPKYYGMFRDAVIRGEIPVCKEISMEMNRIDDLIANPGVYYDDQAVEGWIAYCESELTLTDGSDLSLLKSRWSGIISTTVLVMFSVMHGLRTVRKVFTPTAFSMTPLMVKLRRSLLSTVTSVLCPFTPISFSRLVLMYCMAVFAR